MDSMKNPLLCRSRQSGTGSFSFRKEVQTDENILRKARYHATGQMHIIFSWLNDRNPLPPEEMAKWNIETKKALFKEYLDKIDEDVLTVVE